MIRATIWMFGFIAVVFMLALNDCSKRRSGAIDQGSVTITHEKAHATAEALYSRICALRPRNEYGECYPPLPKGDKK